LAASALEDPAMTKRLRVGIIGVSAERGWARASHVPAVQRLEGVELAAVATSRQESAAAAATAFGAQKAYGTATDLLRDPDIDLVAVCVKVPEHRAVVLGALAAGKHVYCEWPLGRDVREAEELRDAATAAGVHGVHAAIGLQARMSPAVRRARELIAFGQLGRVLSARLYSATAGFGRKVEPAGLYFEQAVNGATLLTICGGHTLDVASAVLGDLVDVAALATTQYPEIEIETGDGERRERRSRSIPDHLLTQSRLCGGAALAVEVAGGRPPDAPFRLEVVGENGTLALNGGAPWGFQAGRIRLSLNGEPQPLDEGEAVSLPDTAANVASMYVALRDDIANATASVPDFDHAARLTWLLAEVAASAETGARIRIAVTNSRNSPENTHSRQRA
jgi:predicted dehydrogenase